MYVCVAFVFVVIVLRLYGKKSTGYFLCYSDNESTLNALASSFQSNPIQSHRFCKCLYLWTQHNLSWEHFWGVRTKNNKTQAFQIPKTKQISIPTLHVKLTPGTYTHHSWCLHVYLSVCVWLSMAFNVNDIESKLTV